MPVRRSLKLDVLLHENLPKSLQTSGHLIASYSPTTGTRRISPYSSPKSHDGGEFGNGPSNEQTNPDQTQEFPRRGQPRAEDRDDLTILLYKIDSSLEKFTETWKSLKHLQALLGRPELESLLGISSTSLDLRGEMKKTRELSLPAPLHPRIPKPPIPQTMSPMSGLLMMKVRKQERPKKKTLKHSPREGIDYLCVVRDLENSIKGLVQSFHKFSFSSVYTDIDSGHLNSYEFLKSIMN